MTPDHGLGMQSSHIHALVADQPLTLYRAFVIGPDDDSIRVLEIVDRVACRQELGI